MSHKRIAIVGGDDRIERQGRWPRELDLRFYQGEKWGGNGQLKGLTMGLSAGKFDAVIILTRWIGHAPCVSICQAATCRVIKWDRGAPELAKVLEDLLEGNERRAA